MKNANDYNVVFYNVMIWWSYGLGSMILDQFQIIYVKYDK